MSFFHLQALNCKEHLQTCIKAQAMVGSLYPTTVLKFRVMATGVELFIVNCHIPLSKLTQIHAFWVSPCHIDAAVVLSFTFTFTCFSVDVCFIYLILYLIVLYGKVMHHNNEPFPRNECLPHIIRLHLTLGRKTFPTAQK